LKVSIIIPVYNSEKYLKESIDSALNQSYKNIEIIAVDDGSPDDSFKILENYSDKIKIIKKENGGIATALNVGIKATTSKWIKLLGADDILLPNSLSTLVDEARKRGKESESCIFYTNYELIDSSGNKIIDYIEPNYNNLTKFERNVRLLDHSIAHPLTSLIHKSIFEKCGFFNEKIKYVEDYEFWLRCSLLHNCSFLLVPKITAKYRVHRNQLTQTRSKEMSKNSEIARNIILQKINPILKEKYLSKLKEFRKNKYPKNIKLIRQIRDATIKVLPDSMSGKILDACMKSKTVNRIYEKVRLSWAESR